MLLRWKTMLTIGTAALLAGLLAPAVPADEEPERRGTIAFHRQPPGGRSKLFIVHPDGSELSQLNTSSPELGRDTFPDWSPDRRFLAFQTDRDHGDFEIYVQDMETQHLTRLTFSPGVDSGPDWSPDAERFLFHSDRAGPPLVWDVWVMNRDGSGQTNLTADSPANDRFGDWSPNGHHIVFWTDRDHHNDEIYEMHADGTHVKNLTQHPASDVIPAWSPDGQRIAFSSNRSGDEEIHVMNVDGSHVTQLTASSGMDRYPAWSPDGRYIAFVSMRDGNAEIYVMDADGSHQTRITYDPGFDFAPTWTQGKPAAPAPAQEHPH
jgi:Tol biopolymer transport system component